MGQNNVQETKSGYKIACTITMNLNNFQGEQL